MNQWGMCKQISASLSSTYKHTRNSFTGDFFILFIFNFYQKQQAIQGGLSTLDDQGQNQDGCLEIPTVQVWVKLLTTENKSTLTKDVKEKVIEYRGKWVNIHMKN